VSTLATQIRDAMFSRIVAAMPTAFKTTRKIPFPTLEPDMIPALGVYLLREQMSPDGDDNDGPPRYMVDAVIGIMLIDLAADPGVLEGKVDDKIDLIENTLLSDYTFLDLRDSATNQPIIESVPQISRTYQFPRDGESYYVEARLQMTFRFRCKFPPVLLHDLNEIDVDVRQGDITTDADSLPQKFTIGTGP
jgi:hypothetical protein